MSLTPTQLSNAVRPAQSTESPDGEAITAAEALSIFNGLKLQHQTTPTELIRTARSIGLIGPALLSLSRAAVISDMALRTDGPVSNPPSAANLRAYGASFSGAPAAEINDAYQNYTGAFHVHRLSLSGNYAEMRHSGFLGNGDERYDDGSDAAAAMSPPRQTSINDLAINDCDGFALLAHDFYEAAGFNTEYVMAFEGQEGHRMLWASRATGGVLVSNDQTHPARRGRHAPRQLVERVTARTELSITDGLDGASYSEEFSNQIGRRLLFGRQYSGD